MTKIQYGAIDKAAILQHHFDNRQNAVPHLNSASQKKVRIHPLWSTFTWRKKHVA